VYVAGGHIAVDSEIQRNARIAGGRVELSPKAKIVGNVTIGAGEVEVDGAIGGYLQVGGGSVRINGPVAGDVEVGAGDVELGPNARIQGKLSYTSDNEIVRDAAAQVIGGVEHIERSDHWPAWHHWHRGAKGGHGWIWSLWLLVMAAILVAALPRFYQDVAETARTRWPLSMLIGFAVLVCVPVAAVIAAITLIGIPLALLMIVLYVALLLVGYVSAGIALGEIVLQRWGAGRATSMGWRITAAVVSMLAISLLHRMPFVGGVVVLAALVTGMGALLIRVRSASSRPSAPAASA
jgi:cytoskeletal protein CcmA (bactofilin family)